MSNDPADRRLHPRYPLLLQVQFNGDADVIAFTENLSEGGLFVRTDRSFKPGQRVGLQLSFSAMLAPVEFEVEIVRARAASSGMPAGVAVKVVAAAPEVKRKLTEIARAAQGKPAASNGCRILLVEDNALLATMYADALKEILAKSSSVEVEMASDGVEALERLSRAPQIDLVISDFHLPRLDGVGLLKKIRSNERLHRLQVVMVTGDVSAESEAALKKAGANVFFRKPLKLAELVFTVQALLKLRP